MSEDLILFVGTPLAFFGVGYLAQRLAKRRSLGGLLGLGCLWLLFTVFMYSGAVSYSSVDWAIYVGALMFVSAPAGVGFLIGGVIGWVRGRATR